MSTEPTRAQRWAAFVDLWAQHHGVAMTPTARKALERAIPPPEVFDQAPAPAPKPAAPQGDLF